MVATFRANQLASGYDNISDLTNIETILVSGKYFNPIDDLGKWDDGLGNIRGDGITTFNGYPSFIWQVGTLTFEQWYYLYTNILGGASSGEVTVKTEMFQIDQYVICNAILDIGQPPTLSRGVRDYNPFTYRFSRVRILEVDEMYGELYTKDASTAQTSIDTTPTLLTGFAADGLSSGTTPAHANDSITVSFAKVYRAIFSIDATATASTQFLFYIRVNAVESNFGCEFTTNATPDPVSTGMTGILSLNANDIVTIYVESDAGGGASLTPTQMQFSLESIST
jgi:hypothetical protein